MKFPEESLWLIGRISEKLMARNIRLGTAESCSGGLASVLCTSIPGSSRWFAGAVVAYANSVKTGVLGVDKALIDNHGAVSGPVVEAMAGGALRVLGVRVSLAVSGIAGPEGGTANKPVGTVWIATAVYPEACPDGHAANEPVLRSFCRHFPGFRDDVRFGAALAALEAVDLALA
ncbi:MAG: CinA family protein [Desulfovibrio sp.]|jgi:nicotinamide-nucleotide amidase|nr:CinA family protein [Desulfovibrio sp.]